MSAQSFGAKCWIRRVVLGGTAFLIACGERRETRAQTGPVSDSTPRRPGVADLVANDTLWLGPGEVRAWNLTPGNYEITMRAPPPPGEPQVVDLAAELVCVPNQADLDIIQCVVRVPTRLVLKHNGVLSATPRRRVAITIQRFPW